MASVTAQRPDAGSFEARIDDALRPPAASLVEGYFDPAGPFAGETFNVLRPNPPTRFTPADLFAVTLLDVRVPPAAARSILGGDASRLARLLRATPADVPLWLATDADLEAAGAAWRCLCDYSGVGFVTAGKLLARKRPNLIPVFDSVVRSALGLPPEGFWVALRAALGDERRRSSIEALRPPGLRTEVTTLRLLDVAVWMQHSAGRNVRRLSEQTPG